ncbi:hypothetical protein PSTT_05847 [Puccinia striiformis]|uniref:Uncharacterized protein n=1 Tax=Puccinia striiformis TaxID=27350 RepID=A0A2S4VM97_9BASI|nr:hypothetical protein PSTT_05847 [Puccinia striiformis]
MNATVTDKAGNDWQTPLQSPTSIRAEPPSEHVGSSQDDDISDEEDADGSEEKEEEGSEDNASGGESEEVNTEIAENLDIPTYDHTSARLDALERRVTSIIGFADGVAWEGLPAVLLQLNRVESRVNKLYFRDDRVSNHEDFEAVNETLQQLMELEKSVRSHLCVFSEAARDGADEPCLDSLDELLKVLHRQIGPMLVSNRIKSFSTAQRIALITNCQQRIVDIRATELSYTDQVITAFGPRVMLEESVFKSEVANTLNNSPEYVALMVELNRISAMVHVMKMAGIMTDDGRVIHVDGTQAPQTVNGVAEIDAARIMIALRGLKSPNSGAGQQHKAAGQIQLFTLSMKIPMNLWHLCLAGLLSPSCAKDRSPGPHPAAEASGIFLQKTNFRRGCKQKYEKTTQSLSGCLMQLISYHPSSSVDRKMLDLTACNPARYALVSGS